jgi:hypothetical protein
MGHFNEYKDILDIEFPADFGPFEEDESVVSSSIEKVFDQLDYTLETKWGISQFVIINNKWDKVIKVPFFGWFVDKCDRNYNCTTEFQNYIVDYAEKSYDIYEEAKEAGVADIFAGMEVLGSIGHNHYAYLQERIAATYDDVSEELRGKIKTSKKSNTYVHKQRCELQGDFMWRHFEEDWLASAVECYGEEFVENFLAFLKEKRLYDWHWGNFGYREDGSPVIFDWGDFGEEAY